MRDRCEIDKGIDNKEIKDTTDKNEVAQLDLSPLQSTVDEVCEVNYEVDCEIDCKADIYVMGGYDRLINKLRAKFVNMVSDGGYRWFTKIEIVNSSGMSIGVIWT